MNLHVYKTESQHSRTKRRFCSALNLHVYKTYTAGKGGDSMFCSAWNLHVYKTSEGNRPYLEGFVVLNIYMYQNMSGKQENSQRVL